MLVSIVLFDGAGSTIAQNRPTKIAQADSDRLIFTTSAHPFGRGIRLSGEPLITKRGSFQDGIVDLPSQFLGISLPGVDVGRAGNRRSPVIVGIAALETQISRSTFAPEERFTPGSFGESFGIILPTVETSKPARDDDSVPGTTNDLFGVTHSCLSSTSLGSCQAAPEPGNDDVLVNHSTHKRCRFFRY